MRNVLATALLGALVLSCAGMQRKSTGEWLPGKALGSDHSVLLMRIPDAIEAGEGPAGGSGTALMSEIRELLLQKNIRLGISEETTVAGAAKSAREQGLAYVLKVVISQWEENATEWSGKPDVVGASAELYDSATGGLVAVASHKVTGSTSAWTSRTPDRFYPEIADNLLGRLFDWRPRARANK